MEYFFKNNLYVIFALIIYSLLVSDNLKDNNKKIIVSYLFIVMLSVFKILDLKIMVFIFLLCFFLYFEFLINDYYKLKIISTIKYKIIDFLYLLIFRYSFVIYLMSLFFISNFALEKIKIPLALSIILFVILFVIVIQIISKNNFELKSFNDIYDNLSKVDFGSFKKLSEDKIEILIYLEDKSFFEREKNYTIFCYDYIRYRIDRIDEILYRLNSGKYKRHSIKGILKFIVYVIRQVLLELKDIPKFLKRAFGHSTIEMQLFRSVAVKSGYTKKYQRKIAEYVYTSIFFKGLKRYFKLNYETVSDERFKNYIIRCYLKNARVFLSSKSYNNINELFKDEDKITRCDFLFYVLSLSSKLDREDAEDIIDSYIKLFGISKSELNSTRRRYKSLRNR